MKTYKITATLLAMLMFYAFSMVASDSRAQALDPKLFGEVKNSAKAVSRHIGATQAPYYGRGLLCVRDDILKKKDQMKDNKIQKAATDCIRDFKYGFENLNDFYSSWESKSKALRDAIKAEK